MCVHSKNVHLAGSLKCVIEVLPELINQKISNFSLEQLIHKMRGESSPYTIFYSKPVSRKVKSQLCQNTFDIETY